MIDIDDLLTTAANRLTTQTDALALRPAPAAARRPVAPRVGVFAVLAVLAGGVVYLARPHPAVNSDVSTLPDGFAAGQYGTEITLTEVDDGDGNPRTLLLRATPTGGDVRVSPVMIDVPALTAAPSSPEPTSAVSPANVPNAQLPGQAVVCVSADNAGGPCPPSGDAAEMTLSTRGPQGQALVSGIPADVVAVTFAAGRVRHWERPLHGAAVFPFPDEADPTATIELRDRTGTVVLTQTATNDNLTAAEIRAAMTTKPTTAKIDQGWFVDVAGDQGYGEFIRHRGRVTLTGFTGPLAIQGVLPGITQQRDNTLPEVWVVTVRRDDADQAISRLRTVAGGSIHQVIDKPGDLQVIVWAADQLSADSIMQVLDTLTQREIRPERGASLDEPRAWSSDTTPIMGGPDGPMLAIFGDTVATIDGHVITALADDVGEVWFLTGFGSYAPAGGPRGPQTRMPHVGEPITPGLWPVPADVGSVTITLTDGTVLTPKVVDIRRLVPDAQLLYFGPDTPYGTIKSVTVTPE